MDGRDLPALRRSVRWLQEQAEQGERQLQKLVYENGSPRSAAQSLYPRHRTDAERRSAQSAERRTTQGPTVASRIWRNLRNENAR